MTTGRRVQLRYLFAPVLVIAAGACASAPPVPSAPAQAPAPVVSLDRKAGWIMRLEQTRVLADPALGADLRALAADPDPGVRRRAVLAIGRVGMSEGIATLVGTLADTEEQVRAMSAFALGIIGDLQGAPALEKLLADSSPLVRGRAAEALGLIGVQAASSAPAVAAAAAGCGAVIAQVPPDDEGLQTGEVEFCRLSIVALARLRQYDSLSRVVLDAQGAPVSRWWPVAFALQRSGDARAADALAALATTSGVYTAGFAIRGLSGLKDARSIPLATATVSRADADIRLKAEAMRALGRLAVRDAVPALIDVVASPDSPRNLVLEALSALAAIGDPRGFDVALDLFASSAPSVRAAAMSAAARMDAEGFLLALSSLERDRDWSVRANLVNVLAGLPAEQSRPALEELVKDADVRVHGPALRAWVRIGAKDADSRLLQALTVPDFATRAAAAALVGERRPDGGAAALVAAYERGDSDATYTARVAALQALARFPIGESRATLERALADREWPVRLIAARLLREAGVSGMSPVRPAPVRQDAAFFESDRVLRPAYTPHAYLQTRLGNVHLELNMVEAPLTTLAFIELARAGYFDGLKIHRLIPNFVVQAGDPRGDGQGGPGYTIRDELSPLPYVRGTLGMALAGRDTGGGQFFITLSPQPHLEGQYTVFGRVVEGWEILDRLSLWDAIDRVLIQDGTTNK